MTWNKPEFIEISVGVEINCYAIAKWAESELVNQLESRDIADERTTRN